MYDFPAAIAETLLPQIRQIIKEEIDASKTAELQAKYISVDEVMKMFSVSRGTIYNWERDGKIKSYLMGGRRLFKYGELIQAVEKIKKYQRNEVPNA